MLCILISSALSGTLQSALIAAGMTEGLDIALVDSLSATAGQRLLVQEACRMREAGGKTAQEIADALRLLVPRVRIFACLDTLSYLARGGRIPKAAAGVGMLMKLKPIVTVSEEGLVAMVGKAIGRHRAGDALIKLFEAHPIDPRYPVLPLYTGGRENCIAFLRQTAQAGYACSIEDAVSIGPTIGTHVGPGAFGLAYIAVE